MTTRKRKTHVKTAQRKPVLDFFKALAYGETFTVAQVADDINRDPTFLRQVVRAGVDRGFLRQVNEGAKRNRVFALKRDQKRRLLELIRTDSLTGSARAFNTRKPKGVTVRNSNSLTTTSSTGASNFTYNLNTNGATLADVVTELGRQTALIQKLVDALA